ncbi:hypothetical protein [Lactococcus lactis]|uniref:hypothetical protein n=1 Tax=Lactococcus lactis TaxID=1358 RepID=UPI0022E64A97|nr:hypothetical protein [Lactococcus lactis]
MKNKKKITITGIALLFIIKIVGKKIITLLVYYGGKFFGLSGVPLFLLVGATSLSLWGAIIYTTYKLNKRRKEQER